MHRPLRSRIGFFRVLAFLILIAALSASLALAQTSADLFDDSILHEVRLVMKPADRTAFKANYLESTYFPADLHWKYKGQDVMVSNVGIRNHGHGSRSPIKPSIKVDMNRNVSGQRFLNLTSLILKSNNEDASLLKEKSVFKLWDRIGMPASRESFTRLFVNDEYLGVYMIIEDTNGQYLNRYLGENNGDFYQFQPQFDGYHWEWRPNCADALVLACSTDPKRWAPDVLDPQQNSNTFNLAPTIDLFRLASEAPDASLDQTMSALLDLRLFLHHVATEIYVSDFDSILGDVFGMNNFFIYRYEKSNFQQLLVWDKDGSFNWLDRPIFQNLDKNVLMRRLMTLANRRNQYLESLYRTSVIAGGSGGWLEWEHRNKYNLIHQAALDDKNKLVLDAGFLVPVDNAAFEAAVVRDRTFIGFRPPFIRASAYANGLTLLTYIKLSEGGAVNAATNAPVIAPGSNATLYGSGFTDKTLAATSGPLPTTLGGITVYVNGFVAPLLFVSPTQINLQVPWELGLGDGTTPFTVTFDGPTTKGTRANSPFNAVFSNTVTAQVKTFAPGVYAVFQGDGKLVSAEPAGAGDLLVIYCTGLGPVTGPMTTGTLASLTTFSTTIQTPAVTVGGVPADILFSGQTPGTAGVYQINVRLRAGIPSGGAPLVVTVAGESSAPLNLPTR